MKQEMTMVTLQINGNEHRLDIPEDMPLLWVLRDVVGLNRNEVRVRHRPVWRVYGSY
jgi:aerobic-type carbon monoxide dehydrogenase small subunit (CoxS/CutS family)